MIHLMPFIGKWTFQTASGEYISLEPSGVLNIASPGSVGANQYFNAYGDTSTGLWLQACNWKYLAFTTPGYSANQNRGSNNADFVLESVASGHYRIIEKAAGGKEYYLDASGTKLTRIVKGGIPPASTVFTQTIVSPGLSEIQQNNAMGLDLTGVYFSGANLTNVSFLSCDLSYVDLSGKDTILKYAVFPGSTVNSTDFTDCNFDQVSIAGVTGTDTIFNGLQVTSSSNFNPATLKKAQFNNVTNVKTSPGRGEGPNMNNITATGAVFNGSNLGGAEFSGSDLSSAHLINVNLGYAQVNGTTFDKATMSFISFVHANADNSSFKGSVLVNAVFDQANIDTCDFTGAQLINSKMSKAMHYDNLNLSAANLTAATLTGMDLTSATITKDTNFTKAQMDSVNLDKQVLDGTNFLAASLRHAVLTNTSFINTILVSADLSFAVLKKSGSKNLSFYGANLSNASLQSVDLTGAQMGATKTVAELDQNAAREFDNGECPSQFFAHPALKPSLVNGDPKVTVRQPGQDWSVETDKHTFLVFNQNNRLMVHKVLAANAAAVLTNAFMQNAILTSANLYGVDMAGAQLYGTGNANHAILEQTNLSNANLATMDLTQAKMYGTNLSFANLVNTIFTKTRLSPTTGARAASLAFASLQGAIFTQAKLTNADLTNAAVSLDIDEGKGIAYGISLFPITDPGILVTGITGLDNLRITDVLIQAFADNHYCIAMTDIETIVITGKLWLIRSSAGGDYEQYILSYDSQNANIGVYGQVPSSSTKPNKIKIPYSSFVAVPVFQSDPAKTSEFITALNSTQISSDLKTLFVNAGYSLVDDAGITVVESGVRWTINNRINNPNKLQSGYGQFDILKQSLAGSIDYLQIYGGVPLLVTRTAVDNQLTTDAVPYGATTQFTDTIMAPDTTCPSGLKFSLLNHGATYQELMTPGLPPHPPKCIPSPTHTCNKA